MCSGPLVEWSVHEEQARRQQSPALHSSGLTHPTSFFFSKLEKKSSRINSVGAEASSKSHQSLCRLFFCFCARWQCQLLLEFLHLREMLHLSAHPKDAACSSHGCEPFKSTLHLALGTYTNPSERRSLSPADTKEALCSKLSPAQVWMKLCPETSTALLLLCNTFSSLWCMFFWCCCLHQAFQSHWSALHFKAEHTNTWLWRTLQHTMRVGTGC